MPDQYLRSPIPRQVVDVGQSTEKLEERFHAKIQNSQYCGAPLDETELGRWRACRRRLVGRWDMYRLDAAKFAKVISTFEAIIGSVDAGQVSGERLDRVLSLWEGVIWDMRDLGCEFSVQYAEHAIGEFRSSMGDHEGLRSAVKVLQGRFEDELGNTFFYRIERNKAHLYDQSNLFGATVFQQFPSATFDIEEAGKCLALDRNTACVMHLMRVVEIGLRAVALSLGIDPNNANWANLINQINARLKQNQSPQMSPSMQQFFAEVVAHLSAVKIAWRNPVMHADKMYDEERAQDIFDHLKRLMRHLARHLDEAGKYFP